MSTDKYGKPYPPMTVTYGLAPEQLKTITVPADKVAEFQGDEAKIKDYALEQIKKEQQESQKAE